MLLRRHYLWYMIFFCYHHLDGAHKQNHLEEQYLLLSIH